MLTPEYLNLIEFNEVVEIYNRLNIEITADIIDRMSKMQDITATTKMQLEILKQTNSTEIFNETLEKTSMLTAETKEALRTLFEDMAKEDIQGYKELYQYRNKPFRLSEHQYKIINQGLKQTNRLLKNMTNTIAFQSKQAYVESVDNAYMKVVSGAFDYNTAIKQSVQELANKGITLKDKLGRNVQLEVAVRRNVLSGIHETANNINRDIEEDLGCNGYEVTAHIGARPTHAEEQGKQFAINSKEAQEYNVGLWSEVESLWSEYNCRHTYFGIILGISEPIYSNKELKDFKNATVTLNGKKVPYYEATQKQRQLENAIRKQKRTVQTLEKANQNSVLQEAKLAQLQRQYTKFCKETGLEKDYARLEVAKDITLKEKNLNYKDITNEFSTIKNNYRVKEQKYYIDEEGNKYEVDGKSVVLKPTKREKEIAEFLGKIYGKEIKIIPRVNKPLNIKTPDYMIEEEKFDLKEIKGRGRYVIAGNLRKKEKQANNFIIDITNSELEYEEAKKQIENIYKSDRFSWIDKIFLIREDAIIKVYKKK